MTFPPSKIGDKYNYQVAAYLKMYGLPDELGSHYDLRQADVHPAPDRISSKHALFGRDISFDIAITRLPWIFFVECKHFSSTKNLDRRSEEFLDAMAEFLSAMGFADVGLMKINFLFVTNENIDRLRKSIKELLSSEENEMAGFLEDVKKAAKKKWKDADTEKATVKDLRRCLLDLRIVMIEDGHLDALSKSEEFNKCMHEMLKKVGERIPSLPPNLPNSTKFAIDYQGEEFVHGNWNAQPVYISEEFLRLLATQYKDSRFFSLNLDKIPFSQNLKIIRDEFTEEDAIYAFSSVANNYFEEKGLKLALVIHSDSNRIIIFDPMWLYQSVYVLKERDHAYVLSKVAEELELTVHPIELRIAIQESYRILKKMHYSSTLFRND